MKKLSTNKGILLAVLAVAAAPLLLVVATKVKHGYDWEDTWTCVRHFGTCKTRYGHKFSESGFARIREGMRGDEIFRILGQPMEGHIVAGKPGDTWRYSLPGPGATHYHERAISMNLPPGKPPTVRESVRRLGQPSSVEEILSN
jgi:hypothetical protein